MKPEITRKALKLPHVKLELLSKVFTFPEEFYIIVCQSK